MPPPDDLRDPYRPEEPPPAPARRVRPSRRALAWGGFGAALVLLVLYLVVPTFRYGANLSPPGPAAWDQPQARPVARPIKIAPVRPAVAPPPQPVADPGDEDGNDDDAATPASDAAPPPAGEADMLSAIDHARRKALDSGNARHWEGGDREGYVVPSAASADGARECRNLVVTIFANGGQPQSSTERYCRDDEDSGWTAR